VTAIVGENGSGKSTLASVLLGLRPSDRGIIHSPGEDGNGLRVSAVFQDFARIEATVGESVRLGDPEASDERVINVLAALGAGGWLRSLPQGLDTAVGSSSRPGLDLSGGQWQRLALGRGLISDDSQLIILDEAMGALDALSERRLMDIQLGEARRRIRAGRAAVVFITHRMATARLADIIYVLSGGRISEAGSHEELVCAGGMYAQMFALQARGYR
jgi:ABC-type multidrug transport system fused ATPase/permease subunit